MSSNNNNNSKGIYCDGECNWKLCGWKKYVGCIKLYSAVVTFVTIDKSRKVFLKNEFYKFYKTF